MDSLVRALDAFDRFLSMLESATGLVELEHAFQLTAQSYPFHGAAFCWWSHPPPSREPDFTMASGDLEGVGQLPHWDEFDVWADSRPIIEQEVDGFPGGRMKVRVALLGPRRRFGVLTAILALGTEDIDRAEYDWRGRFLLMSHVIQHSLALWTSDEHPTLGRREVQCLKLAAEGLKAKQIAIRLGIGQQTVQFHLSRAREKLGCSNTVQAVARAAQYGLLPDVAPSPMEPPFDGTA